MRRDMRLHDNAALYSALSSSYPVKIIFIFDAYILDKLPFKNDRRVSFIHDTLSNLQAKVTSIGATIECVIGTPEQVWYSLFQKYTIREIHVAHDYEPYGLERDTQISFIAKKHGASFLSYKDIVFFEKDEVCKEDGKPYTVFTPYSKKWKNVYYASEKKQFPSEHHLEKLLKQTPIPIPSLEQLGFTYQSYSITSDLMPISCMKTYAEQRDVPAKNATSRLGIHLRFGTISIRQIVYEAAKQSDVFLNELIWRDFYQMILWHFPHVVQGPFKPAYNYILWRNNESEFAAWCQGKTGYPIIDAAMNQLNQTGFMHNRLRMICASFLTKHLLIDWRWGEAYFAAHLLDFELASNNGGWQWSAGCGTDAAPYFRIFNPYEQTKKFDPKYEFITMWLPNLNSLHYPIPIVEHTYARQRCLETYKKALANKDLTI